MNWFVRLNTYAYRGLLFLYPFELRFEFGEEMTWMFGLEIENALEDPLANRRIGSFIGVWWRALSEVPWIALPKYIPGRALLTPALGMMVQMVVVGSMLALATFAQEAMPHDILRGVLTLRP